MPHVTGSLMTRRDLSSVEFWARAGVNLGLRLAIARALKLFLVRPLGVLEILNWNDSLFRKDSSFHSDWGL